MLYFLYTDGESFVLHNQTEDEWFQWDNYYDEWTAVFARENTSELKKIKSINSDGDNDKLEDYFLPPV